jgi:hypothetical protein
MSCSKAQMEYLRVEAQRFAARDSCGGRFGKQGRLSMRVPIEAYFEAIDANGGIQKDGKTIWNSEEWVRDQRRRFPEIDRCPDDIIPRGMRNRFGRVKERVVYPRTSAGSNS